MRPRRIVLSSAGAVPATGGAAAVHLPEVGNGQPFFEVVGQGAAGGLGQHVADAVIAVVNDSVIPHPWPLSQWAWGAALTPGPSPVRRARGGIGDGKGVLDAGEAVEVVILEELGVAARVAFRDSRAGAEVGDGLDVGDAVEGI
jgi:hypothetical protein